MKYSNKELTNVNVLEEAKKLIYYYIICSHHGQ